MALQDSEHRAEILGTNDDIGERIRIERKALGLTYRGLTEALRQHGHTLAPSALQKIEGGKDGKQPRPKISVETVIAFSKVSGVPVIELMKPIALYRQEQHDALQEHFEDLTDRLVNEDRKAILQITTGTMRLIRAWHAIVDQVHGSQYNPDTVVHAGEVLDALYASVESARNGQRSPLRQLDKLGLGLPRHVAAIIETAEYIGNELANEDLRARGLLPMFAVPIKVNEDEEPENWSGHLRAMKAQLDHWERDHGGLND